MTKPVLTTRCIGQATHYSGHPLAPMEYVFEVEKPPSFLQRLWALSLAKKITLAFALGYGALLAAGALELLGVIP